MLYHPYGKTGLKLSALGFGTAYLPTHEDNTCDPDRAAVLLQHAIDRGVNHLDTAFVYMGGTSELGVGRALKNNQRENLVISTKLPSTKKGGNDTALWWSNFEESLRRLDTPYVDILYLHGLSWQEFENHASKPGGALECARKAQSQSLIRHVCFSSHDEPDNVIRLLETGEFAGVLVQYSLITRDYEKVIQRAAELGMGTASMGSLALGKLAQPRTYLGKDEEGWFAISAHELALRFSLANPTLTVALSGMHTIADVENNVQMVEKINQGGDPMPKRWQRFIREKWEEANRNCTLCGKCLPCPQEVNIPENMRYRNWQRTWGLEAEAREAYKLLGEPHWTPWGGSITGKSAGACNQCGECEPRCPIHTPIIQFLGENTATLSTQEANNEA